MRKLNFMLVGIIILFAIGFIYSQYRADHPINKPATLPDGEYYVQISKIDQGTFTFAHITYFIGTEAFNSAKVEAKCDKSDIIECVPTLKNGYYIRPSGAPQFIAPMADNMKILLAYDTSGNASLEELKSEVSLPGYISAFKVDLKNSQIASIKELTRYSSSGGLPRGYVFENYQIAKIMETSCKGDDECQTPMDYLLISSCPYTSICLERKCTVICPGYPDRAE